MPPAPAEQLAHLVFITLKDRSPEAKEALVAACHEYLAGHPGTLHFSVGLRAEAYNRSVNDQTFDVAVVLVFATEADHDRYQNAPRHQEFVDKHLASWAEVRVFDALT